MHPVPRRCSSVTYSRYSPFSRLAGRAPRRPRCLAMIYEIGSVAEQILELGQERTPGALEVAGGEDLLVDSEPLLETVVVPDVEHRAGVDPVREEQVETERAVERVVFVDIAYQQSVRELIRRKRPPELDVVLSAGRGRRGPPGGGGDSSWNALFSSSGRLVDDGWTAEIAIPFKSLRYPSRGDGAHRWGFQVSRTIQHKDETVVWSPVSRDIAGFLTQMGVLDGLSGLSTGRNLEILPTFTGIQIGHLDEETGRFSDDDLIPDLGVNVKYGLTSHLTADFTANPDFSQIESDRPQITLNQRFPLFFPGAPPVLPGGPGDLRHAGPNQPRALADDRGSSCGWQVDRSVDPLCGGGSVEAGGDGA